jgi:thiosulfate/3-mercaptopyruvate sulfurtransferase
MAFPDSKWLIDTATLEAQLSAPDLVVLDASWHLPHEQRDPKAEFHEAHIPGAQFFDIDEIADLESGLPHMLPSAPKFSSRMRKMGIGDGSRIVVYDTKGMFSAPRVWWMFRVMGKDDVAVLDGGLLKWRAEGRPLEDGPAMKRTERHFTVRRNAELIRDLDDVRAINERRAAAQLVDARPAGRFEGRDPEPRPGLRGGHIPGARNLPFSTLVNADGTLKSVPELKAAIARAGVDTAKPIVASCGSGVTAGVVAFALALLGHRQTAVYDGSWAEWGGRSDVEVETGPAR